jgi:predicted transcriptional regulator
MGEIEGKNQTAVGPAASQEKTAILADIANKIRALDNPVKLNILSLLVESGSLSITDISKKLNINFSTAHKYLEQLQAASLVTSKQIADNRLKRVFTIKNFNIELSPKSLFQKATEANNGTKAKFGLFDHNGQVMDFDEEKFSQKYLKRGMPRGTVQLALQEALKQAYNSMTLLELRFLFQDALQKKAENIQNVLVQIEEDRKHKKTFGYALCVEHPNALKQHADGDIFIRNMHKPLMLKFSHDIRNIYTHGGTKGTRAKNLKELLIQIESVIDAVSDYAKVSHILDSFNYLIAPVISKTLTAEDIAELRKFLTNLNSKELRFYIGLDMGIPEWAKELPTAHYYFLDEKKLIKYADYEDIANAITKECIKFLTETKASKILPVFKVYDKKFDKSLIANIPTCLVANMLASWQGKAASYSTGARFDTRWKGWVRVGGVGEVQNITINLPRLASKTKDESKFFKELDALLTQIIDYFGVMAKFATGEFLKYQITFDSALKGRWTCTHIEDSTYYISITGLDEAVYFLSGKKLVEDTKLAEKILKACEKVIATYNKMPIRIELKAEPDENIAKRFYNLDKDNNDIKVKKYSEGIECGDYLTSAKLQQFLLGGHCVSVPKKEFDFEAFAKVKGGLAKLT